MSSILLATHGGAGADGAVRVASLLARRLGAALEALVVLEPLPVVDYGFGVVATYSPDEEEAIDAQLVADASAQLTRCDAHESALRSVIGLPASEIAAAARDADAEAIVVGLGPHGVVARVAAAARDADAEAIVVGLGPHGVVARALGQETVLQLVQVASTPILAVPASVSELPHRVVAAVDFTPTSICAAQVAARWLAAGDVLHLVHVRSAHADHDTGRPPLRIGDDAWRLATLAHELEVADGVRVTTALLDGDTGEGPAAALLHYADHNDADLVALGSHGYGLWKRLALGSVASKVVRLTTKPVLVVPVASVPVDTP